MATGAQAASMTCVGFNAKLTSISLGTLHDSAQNPEPGSLLRTSLRAPLRHFNMMSADPDSTFGFAPKKKVTTYGRAGRRRGQPTTVGTLRRSETSPELPTSFARSPSRSPEAPRVLTRAVSSAKAKQPDIRKYGAGARREPAEEAQSQPLPELPDFESPHAEDTRAKKRRLVRGYSDKGRFTGPYSTPDSSPSGGQSSGAAIEKEVPRSISDPSPSTTSGRTTPVKDIDMEDVVPASMPFSVKTSRTLQNLSVSSTSLGTKKHQIPIRLSLQGPTKPAPKRTARRLPAATHTHGQGPAAQPIRKRRLIDTLAAQADEDSGPSDSEASSQESGGVSIQPPPARSDASPPRASGSTSRPKAIARPVLATKKSGPKFTYSQQRTMLADDDDDLLLGGGGGLGSLGDGPAGGALFNFGRMTKSSTISTFSYLDEDDETANTGAVRSLHELRQAGANSRFADEMDDILDRVGAPSAKPSSLRRGALLELAQKMKHKDFRQQFRNHGDGGNLFKYLENETDLVSGYSILAVVTTLLAATTSAHLIQQLSAQGLGALVSRLLAQTTDIVQLSKDRKQNLSKNGQTTLAAIKFSLLELPVWEPCSPTSLSPRTLALKCLDLVMRQPTHEDEVLSREVTDRMFSILSDGISDPACWDFPSQPESCDFHLALYVLEGHSVSAMQSGLGATWTKQYAPIVANGLETALGRPTNELGDLESLALRISLNITNQNSEASRLFVEKGLLGRLAKAACSAFGVVLQSMKVDSFLSTRVLESLIMMLGVMINFCVYYPPAAGRLEERGDGVGSPLNGLIRVFADNHTKTADADSMEETQLNVALGYLSVLLGYLCLRDSIRERLVLVHPRKSMQPLVDSISEFIAFHHKVAEAEGERKQGSETAALTRLQHLADQLAVLR
ncbi:hypothetical protein BT67DRAFT_453863 [Trichocladium antarcticum]|uniref:Wings apart-like protein C-terminal domain-containing protein n=1 Tax=Trichocladium antarcticum TaxID=1450529 RepID=A0AAN6URY3_9PEZI|nr:hypothetical protein BT67DRAFT_453863 [Trichocladium antarcticum]